MPPPHHLGRWFCHTFGRTAQFLHLLRKKQQGCQQNKQINQPIWITKAQAHPRSAHDTSNSHRFHTLASQKNARQNEPKKLYTSCPKNQTNTAHFTALKPTTAQGPTWVESLLCYTDAPHQTPTTDIGAASALGRMQSFDRAELASPPGQKIPLPHPKGPQRRVANLRSVLFLPFSPFLHLSPTSHCLPLTSRSRSLGRTERFSSGLSLNIHDTKRPSFCISSKWISTWPRTHTHSQEQFTFPSSAFCPTLSSATEKPSHQGGKSTWQNTRRQVVGGLRETAAVEASPPHSEILAAFGHAGTITGKNNKLFLWLKKMPAGQSERAGRALAQDSY